MPVRYVCGIYVMPPSLAEIRSIGMSEIVLFLSVCVCVPQCGMVATVWTCRVKGVYVVSDNLFLFFSVANKCRKYPMCFKRQGTKDSRKKKLQILKPIWILAGWNSSFEGEILFNYRPEHSILTKTRKNERQGTIFRRVKTCTANRNDPVTEENHTKLSWRSLFAQNACGCPTSSLF